MTTLGAQLIPIPDECRGLANRTPHRAPSPHPRKGEGDQNAAHRYSTLPSRRAAAVGKCASSLTPSLSRWEREPRSPRLGKRRRTGSRAGAKSLPLPAGEDQGEGGRAPESELFLLAASRSQRPRSNAALPGHLPSFFTSTFELRPLCSYFSRRAGGRFSGVPSVKPPLLWK
jgi:hypothetical protein